MIYLTGDCHRNYDKFNTENFIEGRSLNKNDYVIVLGDFGIWDNSTYEKSLLNLLNNRQFTTLFIDGNHENFDILNNLEIKEWNGGRVHYIKDSIIHLMRGEIYNIDGLKIFTFGGASSLDKAFRIPGRSWWSEESANKKEYENAIMNLEKNNNEVDYILTHCPPISVMEKLPNEYHMADQQNKFFEKIKNEVSFKHWYFGHSHIDEMIDSKFSILFKSFLKIK